MAEDRGFELGGEFYVWHLSDTGKDLMLIDRITGGMLPQEFFAAVEDAHDQFRGPILYGLIATSMRNKHPEWSVERVLRTALDTRLEDITFLGGEDDEEEATGPPPSADGGASQESSATSKESQDETSSPPSETQV